MLLHGRLHSVRSYFRACPNCACVSHQALPALQSFPYDSAVLAAPQATDPWDFPLPSLPLQACWERGQISDRALLSLSHFQPRASSFCCLMMCKIQEVKIQITSHPPLAFPPSGTAVGRKQPGRGRFCPRPDGATLASGHWADSAVGGRADGRCRSRSGETAPLPWPCQARLSSAPLDWDTPPLWLLLPQSSLTLLLWRVWFLPGPPHPHRRGHPRAALCQGPGCPRMDGLGGQLGFLLSSPARSPTFSLLDLRLEASDSSPARLPRPDWLAGLVRFRKGGLAFDRSGKPELVLNCFVPSLHPVSSWRLPLAPDRRVHAARRCSTPIPGLSLWCLG